ncbi:MAG: beta-galactosidase, partial [Solirubrobacterales bacterium]|nr:beta-galactosidase [Solirubrobacterales bacterium]
MGALGRFRGSAVRLALAGVVAATLASALPAAASAHTVTYDHYSLKLDGRRIYVWSGEFHYWRLPSPSLWRDVLEKMKAAGYNATSIYFDWGYHSPKPGVYDFTGVRDVDELLRIASQVGIYVIARPGPYINAETDSGGFPAWLDTQKGRARSSAPDYTAAYMEWLSHIDPIIARHQFTNGTGTVILYQVENEYGNNTDATYMAQ